MILFRRFSKFSWQIILRSFVYVFYMKILESAGIILSFGGLIQLFKWIFDSSNLRLTENTLTFFFACIFSLQITIILFLNQIQKENNEMKEFLKTKGFKEEEGIVNKMFNNKKAAFDARILWVLVALIILYLLYKRFTL